MDNQNKKNTENYDVSDTQRTIETTFYYIGAAVFFVSLILAAIAATYPNIWQRIRLPPCLFHLITGYFCPGCGGTRAVRALLHGHLLQSIYYHPLVVYAAVVYLTFMLTQTVERLSQHRVSIGMKYHNLYVWIALAILAVNFALKNILHFTVGFVFY